MYITWEYDFTMYNYFLKNTPFYIHVESIRELILTVLQVIISC